MLRRIDPAPVGWRRRAGVGASRLLATGRASLLATCLVLTLAACSGDDEPKPAPSSGSAQASESAPVTTTARIGKVSGRLSDARRAEVLAAATKIVQAWVDGAYVGDLPRTDVTAAFADFTTEARELALKQPAIMSNAASGEGLESATITASTLGLDLVAARGRAIGATARVRITMTLAGEPERTDVVAGRLFLTPLKGKWRVFGYDVRRDEGV
ncbi:hypothetical protein KG112_06385 [Nocardioides sp. zg-ZUI104]|uniref:hypothetical protein n=1 Tax=Nocardioides faecalis TaxID=2803858 RepID=UPI001BCE8AF8|nr:hypothetical protein [Nocardioides faecalis]MBS4752436.1 hypothetical protein [Nocardioides faecalis]